MIDRDGTSEWRENTQFSKIYIYIEGRKERERDNREKNAIAAVFLDVINSR